jgi:hypothetical protein
MALETELGARKDTNTMPEKDDAASISIPPPELGSRVISGTFGLRKLSYVVSEELDLITAATDWVPVPHMSVNFVLTRKKTSDVIALFSSICSVQDPTSLQVRTKLDEAVVSFPEEIQFSGMIPREVQDWAGSCHSYPFIFQNVSRGSHTVTAEYRGASQLAPNLQINISRPSLVVAYQ